MSTNQIVYIDVNNIFPHPNNPRKNLGDLTELAESIKASGIMQNLTVVRRQGANSAGSDSYTAIIGHRRLAAAKEAGLKSVPCIISGMDEKTQVATMLLENIQRSDLTLWEEAQGFQMMLDFEETLDSISAKTGFSKTRVRQRIRLTELDQSKLHSAVERGGTLADYEALNKIKDIKIRNKILDEIGTNNFKWRLQAAIKEEKQAENEPIIIAELNKFALEAKKPNCEIMEYAETIFFEGTKVTKPKDAGKRKYYYTIGSHGITLYRERVKTKTDTVQDKKHQKLAERKNRMKEITKQAFALRFEFIKNFTTVKKHNTDIASLATMALMNGDNVNTEMLQKLLNIKLDKNDRLTFEKLSELSDETQERMLLLTAYCALDDAAKCCYNEWDGCAYRKNKELDYIYNFLKGFGYEISDEEQSYCDGTHELFMQEDDKEGVE